MFIGFIPAMAENTSSPAPAGIGTKTQSRGERSPGPGVSIGRVEGPYGPCVARPHSAHPRRAPPPHKPLRHSASLPSQRPTANRKRRTSRAVRAGREGEIHHERTTMRSRAHLRTHTRELPPARAYADYAVHVDTGDLPSGVDVVDRI